LTPAPKNAILCLNETATEEKVREPEEANVEWKSGGRTTDGRRQMTEF
jgi:hypothetical protein